MNEKLLHLTSNQLENLIERYYSNEKIANLIKEFDLKLRPTELVKNFPPEVLDSECIYCGTNIIRSRISREYSKWRTASEYCPNCGHENKGFCSCPNCKEQDRLKKEIERQHKQDFINSWIVIDEDSKIDFDLLTFTDKVYLGAILREGISEDYNYIKPFENFTNSISPTSEFRSEIVDRLIEINAIVIHPSIDSEFIEIIDYENGNYRYFPYKVKWALNVKKEHINKVPLIELLINPLNIRESEYEEAFFLWKKIALYESIEYFHHSVTNILGIEYSIGDKTKSVLTDLLNDYSVSQIYGILYKSTNNALRFQAEKGVSTKHASNTIIGNAQSFGERAKINNWDLQKYGRIKDCPESSLSKFFFERILKIGYDGFNEKPNFSRIGK